MSSVSDWKTVEFGEIAEQITNRIDNPKDSELADYIGLEHVKSNNLKISSYGKANDVVSSKFVCRRGDIVFGRRRAYLRKLAISDRDALVSTDAMVIRPKKNFSKEFLLLVMQTDRFWDEVISRSAGSLSPRIKWRDLSSIDVLLPPPEVQGKISKLIFSVQDNIEKNENLIQVAEKLKKGLLEELLTKGIGHKKFKKTELGEIPEEWNVFTIGSLCSVRRGASPRPIEDKRYFSEKGPGWIRISDITSVYKYVRKTEQYLSGMGASASVRVGKGDLVMSICATIGKPIIIDMDACIHDGFVLFQDIKKSVLPEYLFYILLRNESYFKSQKQEGTQGNLNTLIVAGTRIAIPDKIEEQKVIVSLLNNMDGLIDNLNNALENGKLLKRRLLNDFMCRKLLV